MDLPHVDFSIVLNDLQFKSPFAIIGVTVKQHK